MGNRRCCSSHIRRPDRTWQNEQGAQPIIPMVGPLGRGRRRAPQDGRPLRHNSPASCPPGGSRGRQMHTHDPGAWAGAAGKDPITLCVESTHDELLRQDPMTCTPGASYQESALSGAFLRPNDDGSLQPCTAHTEVEVEGAICIAELERAVWPARRGPSLCQQVIKVATACIGQTSAMSWLKISSIQVKSSFMVADLGF